MALPLAAAIAAPIAGALVSGLLGKKAADKAAQANQDMASYNAAVQEDFAKQGVRWKVADAKAAGINPLVALGAPTASFSPVGVGATPDFSMANAVSGMGQDIGRAVQATRTQEERTLANLQIQRAQLELQGVGLDNQLKQSQLLKQNATGPAFPGSSTFISGQGNSSPRVTEKPLERTMSLPGAPQSEPGAIPDIGWAKTRTGVVPVPSADVKQRIEDSMPHEWSHFIRNNLAANWGGGTKPPKSALPKGAVDWEWSFWDQEYQAVDRKGETPWARAQKWYDRNLRWPKK